MQTDKIEGIPLKELVDLKFGQQRWVVKVCNNVVQPACGACIHGQEAFATSDACQNCITYGNKHLIRMGWTPYA